MAENSSYSLFDDGRFLLGIDRKKLIKMVEKKLNTLRESLLLVSKGTSNVSQHY